MSTEPSAIEKGVPIPKHGTGRKHEYEDLYERLEPGDSFTVPWSKENAVRSWLAFYHGRNPEGRRFKTARDAKDPERLRIWRIDGLPEGE